MTDLLSTRPAAIVFDNDGLLVDSETCWHEAERLLFTRRGRVYADEQRAEVFGKSVPATAALLAVPLGEVGNESALVEEMLTAVADVIAAEVRPMPGALQLLIHLHGRVPVAVASNSPRHLVELALDRAGLRPFFEVLVSRDDVSAGKPAPDLYLEACARLGVDPAESVAFEDSLVGLASARAAGMRVVGVPSMRGQEFPADLVVDSLADPRLFSWL